MKRGVALLLPIVVICALSGCAARDAKPATVFGSRPALSGEPLPLKSALSDTNLGRTLSVEGRASAVCQAKGCWMVLTDGAHSVRVTFRDYAFFVPKDLAGRTIVAEGVLSRRTLSADDAEHLDQESGLPATSVPGPVEEWSFVATSVMVSSAN